MASTAATRTCYECGKDIDFWHIIPGLDDRHPPRSIVCGACLYGLAATGWDYEHRNDPPHEIPFGVGRCAVIHPLGCALANCGEDEDARTD